MRLKADLFPYPVLHRGLDDYINSEFNMDIDLAEENPLEVIYKVSFSLKDEALESLINENLACFAVHIEGEASSYRKLYKLSKHDTEIDLIFKTEEISKKVFINGMIIAKDNIKNYSNSNFNPIYYGRNLEIPLVERGEILAFDNTVEVHFEFENRENPNARSMIQIASSDDELMQIDISGNKIIVYLPAKDYNAYFQLSGTSDSKQHLLLVTIILPTLTYALERMATGGATDFTLDWIQSMTQLLEENNIDVEQLKDDPTRSLEYAQKLLNYPFKNVLFNFLTEEERINE